jgi:hypothetical protein
MVLFRSLMAANLLVAAVVVAFFLWGVADGTVSSFNILLWLAMLAGVTALPWTGWTLRQRGRVGAASVVLLVLAVPAVLALCAIAVMVVSPPDWR